MKTPFLSVIVPCYNEQKNLERGVLEQMTSYLDKQSYNYELIVSDDESTDNSRNIVKAYKHPHVHLLENPHGGKAYALRYGLLQAQGEFCLFTDMDQSTPIDQLAKLLSFTKEGAQVVIGSRGSARENSSLLRKLASAMFGLVRRSILLPHIIDTQCGFKLLETSLGKTVFSKMEIFKHAAQAKGWTVAAWDVEFLFLAEKFGSRVVEVPVEWKNEDTSTSKQRGIRKFVHESIDMLQQIIRVRINDLSGHYAH